MKNALIKLLKVKSIVTILMTIALVLLLSGVFNPPKEVLSLYATAYVAVITYFFTRKDKEVE